MEQLLHLSFIINLLTPLFCACLLAIHALFTKTVVEKTISSIAHTAFIFYFLATLCTLTCWLLMGAMPVQYQLGVLHENARHSFPILLYIDIASAVFLFITAAISNIIVFYSRRYLHNDPGYRRFYLILSLFIFGMTLLICAGTFSLLFAGWEIVGISSFLLIGFYWHRPKAILNAYRAYCIYRVCDVGLLVSALISHLIWHKQDLFYELRTGQLMATLSHAPLWQQWLLSTMILLAVLGKSAQFPFSYWLPKAMEGPTPSSAIFYGSLSIHAGVFLLIRTFAIWHHTPGFAWLLAGIGIITALLSTLFSRVQTNIKGQIGYASIAQVGIMLIELALGLTHLALAHLVGNAFLRCFQLLTSSSVVSEQLQIHRALEGVSIHNRWSIEHWLPKKLESSLYLFALHEGYLESITRLFLLQPLERICIFFNRFATQIAAPIITLICLGTGFLPQSPLWLSSFLLVITLFCAFCALGERKSGLSILNFVLVGNCLCVFALLTTHSEFEQDALFYICGLLVAWVMTKEAFAHVSRTRLVENLNHFSGLWSQYPRAGAIALIGILAMSGAPIAITFLGEDLLLQRALSNGLEFVLVLNGIFILNGISLIRLYSYVFFGERHAEIEEIHLDYSPFQTTAHLFLFFASNALILSTIG